MYTLEDISNINDLIIETERMEKFLEVTMVDKGGRISASRWNDNTDTVLIASPELIEKVAMTIKKQIAENKRLLRTMGVLYK